MSGFEPSPGWREVSYVEYRDDALPVEQTATIRVGDQDPRYFIREQPTSPLPTEPYTVVRVTWPDGEAALFVHDGEKIRPISTNAWVDSVAPGSRVEVLAEPRTVTAKAVLGEVADWFEREAGAEPATDWRRRTADTIRREFGAGS